MEQFKVYLSEPAERDLQDIYAYIATVLSAPDAALATLDALEKAMRTLRNTPKRNALVRDDYLAIQGYRREIAKNYSIFYKINEVHGVVTVSRILYDRRDWKRIL